MRLRTFSRQTLEPQQFIRKNLSRNDLRDKIRRLMRLRTEKGRPLVNALVIISRPRTGNWLPPTGNWFSKIFGLNCDRLHPAVGGRDTKPPELSVGPFPSMSSYESTCTITTVTSLRALSVTGRRDPFPNKSAFMIFSHFVGLCGEGQPVTLQDQMADPLLASLRWI
jgi:hypothetical protein